MFGEVDCTPQLKKKNGQTLWVNFYYKWVYGHQREGAFACCQSVKSSSGALQTQRCNLQRRRWEPQCHVSHTKDFGGRKLGCAANPPEPGCTSIQALPFQTTSKKVPFSPLIEHLSEQSLRVDGVKELIDGTFEVRLIDFALLLLNSWWRYKLPCEQQGFRGALCPTRMLIRMKERKTYGAV